MAEKILVTTESSYVLTDLKLFAALLLVLLGSLGALYYYDAQHPFITSVAEQFFNFLLQQW